MKSDMIFFNCVRYGPPHNKPRIAPGLCNRLRGMFSVYTFADFLDIPFGFSWHPSNPCPCQFHEVFEVPSDVVYENERNWLNKKSNQIEIKLFRTFDTPWHFWNTIIKNDYDLAWETFYDRYITHLRKLKPTHQLNKSINNFVKKVNMEGRIGIHIRKTDFGKVRGKKTLKYRAMDTDDLYFENLDNEIKKNPNIQFFLATDNAESRELYLNRYSDRIVTFLSEDDFKFSKLRQTSVLDAVGDLWVLSKCKKIYGAKSSSFCEIASELNNAELAFK